MATGGCGEGRLIGRVNTFAGVSRLARDASSGTAVDGRGPRLRRAPCHVRRAGYKAPVGQRPPDGLAPVRHPQFPEDRLEMGADRVLANEKRLGNGAVRHSCRYQCQSLALPGREPPPGAGPLPRALASKSPGLNDLAASDSPQRGDELVSR